MTNVQQDCIICQGVAGDQQLQRIQVWEDAYWRLTTSLFAEVSGFSYLEPKRHIPSITELDGEEARSLGEVLARVTSVLRDEAEAKSVYVYLFGDDLAHLHFHLAPHQANDALSNQMIRGEIIEEKLEGGATRFVSKEFPPLPEEALRAVAQHIQQRLTSFDSSK